MAGFAQLGSPGFSISPPRLTPTVPGASFNKLAVPAPPRENAGFYDPTSGVASSQIDDSALHRGNVFLSQAGLGRLGNNASTASDPYGFSPEDLNAITRFVANPLDPTGISNYRNLVNRIRGNIGGLSGFTPTQYNQFTNDLPIRFASGFNILPPTVLQNFAAAPTTMPGLRF